MDNRFEDKVAVITGAAGGIGRAAAERFASEGAKVVLVDLPGTPLEESVAAVERAGSEAHVVTADVTSDADCQRYAAEAKQRFGGIDAFFNNAGIEGFVGSTLEYPEEMFDRVIAVNLKGVWLGLKAVVPLMMERGGGAIVNTASVAGLGATANTFAYGASKHAVVGMTKSAAVEFAPSNIRTNAICPSPIETEMMRRLERGIDPDEPDVVKTQMAARNPLGRYGEPSEVASAVVYLCSDDASFLNGVIMPVDGGSRAR
jgi:3alpha(or 20beta)-hydroxysteroid dehydrogenase